MNIKHIIASASLIAAATGAFAGNGISSSGQVVTNQQVYEELLRSRAAGELDYTDATYPLAPREIAREVTRAGTVQITVTAKNFPKASW